MQILQPWTIQGLLRTAESASPLAAPAVAASLLAFMRHAPYAIGPVERDDWMLCMRQALAEQVADPALRAAV